MAAIRSRGVSIKASDTVIPAWEMAIKNRSITSQLIFHSDRGVQYACCEFRDVLKTQPLVIQSMSRKANCWDNAVAESFFRTLKTELSHHMEIKPVAITKIEIFESSKSGTTETGSMNHLAT